MELPDWQQNDEWMFKLHPLPFLQGCPFLQDDNRCSVYATRPSPCRRFVAGSSECQEARARVGLEPLLISHDQRVETISPTRGSP